jgi:Tfp pilus assembly protein PilW
MMKRASGYSIIELLIVIFILSFVLAAGSDMFVGTLRGYKQQSKIAETSIEGIIGLEMMRRDLENAGYGLPWAYPSGGLAAYGEAVNATASGYNDSSTAPPRAVLCGENIVADPGALGVVSGSDYLVLKAATLARNDPSTRWNYLMTDGTTTSWVTSGNENLIANTDRVIVLSPGTDVNNTRTLVLNGANFSATYTAPNSLSAFSSANETRIIYGISDSNLRMPFNRADYYVSTNGTTLPGRCAPGTGVLLKSIVNQADGQFSDKLPLLDCVADMQVVTFLDTAGTGPPYTQMDGINLPLALQVRDQLKEVDVYILAQEGQRDTSRNVPYPGNVFHVGPVAGGRDFNLAGIANYQNYRWKLYTLIVRPNNLR